MVFKPVDDRRRVTDEEARQAVVSRNRAEALLQIYHHQKDQDFAARWDRFKDGEHFDEQDLVYAATQRCPCGYGLAHPKDCDVRHAWNCAGVLLGMVPLSLRTGISHRVGLSFMFYDVKSEGQPSARGATTRGTIKPSPDWGSEEGPAS